MNILINWDWCNQKGVLSTIDIIRNILQIIRFIVPIGLIVMTSVDIFKKVINPDDKDGQKKILNRIIAGVIVFFVPLMIRFVLTIVEKGGKTVDHNNTNCLWRLIYPNE